MSLRQRVEKILRDIDEQIDETTNADIIAWPRHLRCLKAAIEGLLKGIGPTGADHTDGLAIDTLDEICYIWENNQPAKGD